MAGNPQLTCPPVGGFEADLVNLAPTVPPGNFVPATGFTVAATFAAGGFFAWLFTLPGIPVPYTVTYYYESFGPGPEGTLGVVAFSSNAGSVPGAAVCTNPPHISVFDYGPAVTALVVGPGVLTAGETYKLTAVASVPIMGATASAEGPIITVT